MGGKTGLYFVGFNRKKGIVGERDTAVALNASDFRGINRNQTQNAVFVDLCRGHPEQTDTARCLTARYGQTTLSNHQRERSGVLLIKEATKRGYKEAYLGDSVDLGYAGSNTRRGRVGRDIAHTLETSSIQGIVERGGRIRRLMPRECLRLQGFAEDQIDRLLAITSDAQAYKQAGNSVTVTPVPVPALGIEGGRSSNSCSGASSSSMEGKRSHIIGACCLGRYRSSRTVDKQIAATRVRSPRNQGHFLPLRRGLSTGRRDRGRPAGIRTAGGLGNAGEGCSQGPPRHRPSF